MKNKVLIIAIILSMCVAMVGCGAEAEATTDIAPKEPVSQTVQETVSEETETMETESEESIVEDTKIDESEAKEMLKSYSDKISEANIENYSEELVYAFTTNINEGRTAEESFNLALQHVIELKAYDEEVAQAEKAKHDAEAREAEANKLAEQQAKESAKEEAPSNEEPVSVPIPKEEEQLIQQTEQQEPAPTPSDNGVPSGQGQQPDGSFIYSDGSVSYVGETYVTPSGQKFTDLGDAGF